MKEITIARAFMETVGKMTMFDYQVEFIKSCLKKKRVVGIFSRQTGKTTLVALFCPFRALQRSNYHIIIIGPVDRQAGEMMDRIRAYCNNSQLIKNHIESSTQREIRFTNGSWIRAMPTGDTGDNIRGQTADLIVLEESSFIKTNIVNQVILPMIASKGSEGALIQIGTPFIKNHFYEASLSDKYAVHQYDYTYCPMLTEEFIEEQRSSLTDMEFAMEYEAKFIADTDCYFNPDMINSAVKDYELVQKNQIY